MLSEGVDPARWAQSVFIHPTRQQFEEPFTTAAFLQLKRKLQLRCDSAGFAPTQAYHATVLLQGVNKHREWLAMCAATRVLCDAPIGFSVAKSHTFHVQYGGGRPFIGLVACEEPLDSLSVSAHFVPRGDEGR